MLKKQALKFGAIHVLELVTRKQELSKMASKSSQAIKRWVKLHMPEKSNAELWYLSMQCLLELERRDSDTSIGLSFDHPLNVFLDRDDESV